MPLDDETLKALAGLLRAERVAALGTLRGGAPFVSLVAFAARDDFSGFLVHISRLAVHTQDLMRDPRASLMVAEADREGTRDPQTLGRLSIQGEARELATDTAEWMRARALYVERFPDSEVTFRLGDFSIWEVVPSAARYVAGFGRIHNIPAEELKRASQAP